MTQEEKAKAYDEALEKAKIWKDKSGMPKDKQGILDDIFHELAEPEDEKVRKGIPELVRQSSEVLDKQNQNNMIAWLEKQGEKPQGKSALEAINEVKVDNSNSVKPADKVEPKFKVGDWITNGQLTCKVLSVTGKSYELHLYNDDYCHFETDVQSIDKDYHLWTIKDAKDGDVLCVKYGNDEMPFIFTGKKDNVAYCALNSFGEFVLSIAEWLLKTSVLPTTKEQRDLLFKKMIEAGYEWDAEKKELKEMKVTASTYCSENCKGYQETGKCFADGECDSKRKYDNMLDSCEIEHIEDGKFYYCIKDYYAGGNKRVSKGDVVQAHRGMSMMALGAKANEYFLPVYQMPNRGWSEEDDDALGQAIMAVEDVMYDATNNCYAMYKLPFSEVIERLKSIRGKER